MSVSMLRDVIRSVLDRIGTETSWTSPQYRIAIILRSSKLFVMLWVESRFLALASISLKIEFSLSSSNWTIFV